MSFGFSVGDFVTLIQLTKTTYANCVKAGPEYNEIAIEIRCLHRVLKPLRDEAGKPDSGLFRQDQGAAEELKTAIDGCQHILDDLQILLARYEGLSTTSETASAPKKLWHRFRFGSKIEQLGAVRWKIIAYTSTISVLLDAVQLRATSRVEEKLDNVSSQMTGGFEGLKRAVLGMAIKSRAEQRGGSSLSLLSLSTYAGDDKEVWRELRRQLILQGFRSKALDRHKDLVQAYMLKLEQSGILDEVSAASGPNISQPWWEKRAFVETASSLRGLQPIGERESTSQLYPSEESNTSPPPSYSINEPNNDGLSSAIPLAGESMLLNPESQSMPKLPPPSQVRRPVMPSNATPKILWPMDSEESEKETSGLKRPRRVRAKRKSNHSDSKAD
jgi:hypothetical protein